MTGNISTGNGTITRQGASVVTHSFDFTYATAALVSGYKLPGLHISASASNPVIVVAELLITTAFSGGSVASVKVGTALTGSQIATTTTLTAGLQSNISSTNNLRFTSDFDVFISTGTGSPTAGAATLILRVIPVNTATS